MPSNIRINNRVASTLQVGDVIAERAYYGSSEVFTAAFDPDAFTYIAAVEAADEQALEEGVKQAIDGFVTGCKADGIWDAIKASCILAGARTLNGCLVPLAGPAPTNFNFVSADYHRKTGLKGDGSTKYLDSNRANNADPQDSNHNAVYRSDPGSNSALIGAGQTSFGANNIGLTSNPLKYFFRSRSSNVFISSLDAELGFVAATRNTSTHYTLREGGSNTVIDNDSKTPTTDNVLVFARNASQTLDQLRSDARLSFYSIGEAIDLAALDARVTTLMTEIEAALT